MDSSFHVLYNALSPADVKYYAYQLLKGIIIIVADDDDDDDDAVAAAS